MIAAIQLLVNEKHRSQKQLAWEHPLLFKTKKGLFEKNEASNNLNFSPALNKTHGFLAGWRARCASNYKLTTFTYKACCVSFRTNLTHGQPSWELHSSPENLPCHSHLLSVANHDAALSSRNLIRGQESHRADENWHRSVVALC